MTTALGVTGTDTGVGKTVVAAALVAALVGRGLRVGVLKPVETGVADGEEPADAGLLRAAAGGLDSLADVCPVVLPEPLAPQAAAERAGRPIGLAALDAAFARATAGREVTIVEGAGGLLVPIADDVAYDTLFRRWRLGVIVVAANRLGALNHTALTVRAAAESGLQVEAVVLNTVAAGPPGLAERTNEAMLRRLLPRHCVLTFPFLPGPRHIPALAAAAESCGLLSALSSLPLPVA